MACTMDHMLSNDMAALSADKQNVKFVTAVDDNGRLCIVIACYQTKLISIYSLF
jgi:hypothetical protein